MSRTEFVALIAMMFAVVAFSMDAMLPAFPAITAELSAADPARVPLILTAFFLGLGVGTFFAGPLSDAFGRKSVMVAGTLLYIGASVVAWASATLEILLVARVFQGLGASGPRVVAMAVTRDLFAGREMARIVSFIMIVFALVPGFAPAMSVGIINVFGWRGIFVAFVVFSSISVVWMMIRLPETLPQPSRRPLRVKLLLAAAGEVISHPTVRLSIMVQTLAMGMLIGMLLLVQQIYDQNYGRAASFPYWFGATALISASASWINAVLVVRFGMRKLITFAMATQILISSLLLIFNLPGLAEPYGFAVFIVWQVSLFLQAGLTLGNLNAIGMEPMGHIAGMASSIMAGLSTVLAAFLASTVVLFFDGTVRPLLIYVLVLATLSFCLMLVMRRTELRRSL